MGPGRKDHRRSDSDETRRLEDRRRALKRRTAELQGRVEELERLLQTEAAFRGLIENSADAVALCARDGTFLYASPAVLQLLGCSLQELLRSSTLSWMHPQDVGTAKEKIDELLGKPGATARLQLRLQHRDGSWRWAEAAAKNLLEEPRLKGVLYNYWDITAAKGLEEQLIHQGMHDPLTGLANRRLLELRLQQAISDAPQSNRSVGLLCVDIDGFKLVNDSFGHSTGDALLLEIADRLKRSIGPSDTLARTGDDEFTVVIWDVAGPEGARPIAQNLLSAFHEPFQLEGNELVITARSGISIFPQDGDTVDVLWRKCDIATHDPKWLGKNDFTFFSAEMSQRAPERLRLENDLRRVLERNELVLHYQPLFDLEGGKVVGTEALLRWKHPELGMIPPVKFIPIAEETGTIVAIGRWVLREACRQNEVWQSSGKAAIKVAVNVSALQFGRGDFVDTVAEALQDSGLKAAFLELELTESLLTRRVEETAARMLQLRALGVRISLDDFGTGYSSLSQLQQLPIDTIKIDRSFLRDIDSGSSNIALIEAIVALAHSLGMSVVAEGIETPKQLDVLRLAGCDHGQGFLMGRPGPSEDSHKFLEEAAQPEKSKTILLVEDEEMVLLLVRTVLRKHGYQVLEARNGRDAMTICRKYSNTIDLLITDVMMPGVTGYELAKDVAAICPKLPVIYISGYGGEGPSRGQQLTWFLAKPFSAESVVKTVEDALARHEPDL